MRKLKLTGSGERHYVPRDSLKCLEHGISRDQKQGTSAGKGGFSGFKIPFRRLGWSGYRLFLIKE